MDRVLVWAGCKNVRDLGGLPTRGGGRTALKAVVRSDHPNNRSPEGWASLAEYGIRTVVTLTTDGVDLDPQLVKEPLPELSTVAVDIEDLNDYDFKQRWADTGLWGTPLYWADALRRWPDRHAAAVRAVAQADRGGVLIHCGRGHDRTGIVSLLLLHLVGVEPNAIAADYELSQLTLAPGERELFSRTMAAQTATAREAVLRVLDTVPIEKTLRLGGLADADMARLQARLGP
ncbi:MAG: tyrosine-protein phosphatase [Actinomycetota bacterium]|jgi:hypothetical protein|nr:tyrosine-protein phosphatase [Actinomycetota bacterium]